MPPVEYRFGRYRLLPAARELWLDGRMVPSQRLVFDCLAYLVEHRDRAVGRDELVAAVWGRVDVAEARINELVLRVRRLIGDDGQVQRAIRTLSGFGYRWVMSVEVIALSAAGDAAEPVEASVQIAPVNSAPAAASPETETAGADRDALPQQSVRNGIVRRLALAGFVVLVVAVGVYAAMRALGDRASGAGEPIRTVMVLPLAVDAPREAGWVRLGAMDLIADRLRSAGLPVLPSEDVLMALRAQDQDGAAVAFDRLDHRLGVGLLVSGSAVRSANGWTVALSSVTADGRRRQAEAEQGDAIAAARDAADRLLIALGQSPPPAPAARSDDEAFDERLQQAQAAVLAGDLDRARELLTALPEPQREHSLARFQRAQIDLLAGRLDEARSGYDELIRRPEMAADPVLYGRVLAGRAAARFRGRDFAGAESDFDAAVAALKDRSAARDLGRALSGRGGARIALARFDLAAADLGQARIELQQAGDHPGLAQVDAYFGLLESQRGRFDLALPHLAKAADTFEAFGIVERTLSALLALFDAQAQLLRWREAFAISERQWALREHVGDPGLAVVIAARRGRALLALGRYREATALLAQTESRHADVRPGAVRYLHDFQADVAWHLRRYAATVDAADRALATWPDDPEHDRRGYLILLRQRALIADRRADPARVERLLPPDDIGEASPALDVARAEWAAQRGDGHRARQFFEMALKTAQDRGVPAQIALAAVAYADWLLAAGQLDEASALAGRVGPWAESDYDCALLQVAVLRRHRRREPWAVALRQAQALAGEREIPETLRTPPAS